MYELKFSLQDIQIVAAALRELPYKNVAALLQNLDEQLKPQMEKPAEPQE